jgi:regulator of sirC expression with transglutaminase-like and TPR domain
LCEIAANPRGDLAAGALSIAKEEYPTLDVGAYLDYLDRLAERVQRSVLADQHEDDWRKALTEHVFGRERFAGNVERYDDPRNSYLNDVIDRRLGIPITLAIIYLSIGHRLARPAVGVSAPGHFLVRHGDQLLDPFDGGRVIDTRSLVARLKRAGVANPREQLHELLAEPPDNRRILVRVLANLRANHIAQNDFPRALRVVDCLVQLDPAQPGWLRDRGLLLNHLECPRAAIADLEGYLERSPESSDGEAIHQVLAALYRDLPSLQ